MIECWHFIRDDGRMRDGAQAEVGVTYETYRPIKLCEWGYHGSRRILDALNYAPGSLVCRVEIGGEIIEDTDKLVGQSRKILWMFDATRILHVWSCDIAERLLRTCDTADTRCWNGIQVKREWVDGQRTDAELEAAQVAAWDASRDAARDAAQVAARDASRSGAWDASRAAAWAASRAASRAAAWAASRAAAWDAAQVAAWDAARDAAQVAAWAAARAASRAAAQVAAWSVARSGAWDAAWDAAQVAAWAASRDASQFAARSVARSGARSGAWYVAWAELSQELEERIMRERGV